MMDDDDWLARLKAYLTLVNDENYLEASSVAGDLLKEAKNRQANDLLEHLYECHAKVLLQTEAFTDLLLLFAQMPPPVREKLRQLEFYTLYRLERYQQVLEKTTSQTLVEQHLRAQALHHRHQSASDIYQTMEDDDQEAVWTNWLAGEIAHQLPMVPMSMSTLPRSDMMAHAQQNPLALDLALNLATADLIGQDSHAARALLQSALAHVDDEEERSALEAQLQWSRDYWSGHVTAPASTLTTSTSLAVVQSINRALAQASPTRALTMLEQVADNKLTPLQRRLLVYNRALLQLRADEIDGCRQTCQTLLSSLRLGKKQTSLPPVDDASHRLWWESRVAVVEAYCDAHKKPKTKKEDPLSTVLAKLDAMESSPVADHALAYVKLHQAELHHEQGPTSRLALLQSLPTSIQKRPAVIATLASLHEQVGDRAAAAALLQSASDENPLLLADFSMSQGNYQVAADLYAKHAQENDDMETTARLVRALSFVDPQRASAIWATASPDLIDDDGDDENGPELEQRELPRLKRSMRKTSTLVVMPTNGENSSKKSAEAVLRRRARQREEYLEKLQAKGLPTTSKPDPERWLPKYERSYARRRRHRGGPHKGAQGGVSEKDAAKLDVAARQAARASGEAEASGPSTAHMTVVSSSDGVGRRKGGKR